MGVQVKICGLKTLSILEAAITAGADFVGFVLVEKSPRFIEAEPAGQLVEASRGRTKSVILLSDPDDETLKLVSAMQPDFLQLHGSESIERVSEIHEAYGIPLIKAIGVSSTEDVAVAERYRPMTDLILLDAKPPANSDITGGHGVPFDWDLLAGDQRPGFEFMLSGGLTPDNVARAIDQTHPYAVDVSSGVESSRGVKSEKLISAFLKAAKG